MESLVLQLWDALHGTYNSATGQVIDLSILDTLPSRPAREWAPFSALELKEALSVCSGNLAPGPDHITWVHLKWIVAAPGCLDVFSTLVNACLWVGHWPWHFKDSVSVVIPKPGEGRGFMLPGKVTHKYFYYSTHTNHTNKTH